MSFKMQEVEYKGVKSNVLVGLATLAGKVPTKFKTLNNENKTEYVYVQIKFDTPNGEVTMPAQLFKGNLTKMEENGGEFEVGQNYLTTISRVPSRKVEGEFINLAQMSHLQNVGVDNPAINSMWAEAGLDINANVVGADSVASVA